ncbi:30S ribosomal protein S24e, partial [Candidatus Bathyarchaeota archaeon]
MKITVISTKDNPLLGRREIDFEIQHPSTPRRVDVRKEMAAQMGVDVEKVYIVKLETKTGSHRTLGRAHIYDTVERALLVEREHIVERNKL